MKPYLIIDFDSTFVAGEAFDELAEIVLKDAPDRSARVAEIVNTTAAGMEGRISFGESLERRIKTLRPWQVHLDALVEVLKSRVTPSVVAERDFLATEAGRIYIVSGGFREFIEPVVGEYGIAPDHVLANRFVWGSDGAVSGCDATSPLAHSGGKSKVVAALKLAGPVVVVGDALSDYEVRAQGAADAFVAFTENMVRPGVADKADVVAGDFGEVVAFCYSGRREHARV